MAKTRLGMGAGKEVSIMGGDGTALTLFDPEVVVAYCAGVDAKEGMW